MLICGECGQKAASLAQNLCMTCAPELHGLATQRASRRDDLVSILRISDEPLSNAAADRIEELERLHAQHVDFTQKDETCRAAQHNASFSGAADPTDCGWPTCFCYQHDREVVDELREQGWISWGEAWKLRNEIATLRKALADIHNQDASGILDAVDEAVGNAVREIRQTCRTALRTGGEA